jgi:hypothetical protein
MNLSVQGSWPCHHREDLILCAYGQRRSGTTLVSLEWARASLSAEHGREARQGDEGCVPDGNGPRGTGSSRAGPELAERVSPDAWEWRGRGGSLASTLLGWELGIRTHPSTPRHAQGDPTHGVWRLMGRSDGRLCAMLARSAQSTRIIPASLAPARGEPAQKCD